MKEIKGSAWAFRTLMQRAADEIAAGGELKPAKVLHKGPNLAKVHIGFFAARLLRMKRRA